MATEGLALSMNLPDGRRPFVWHGRGAIEDMRVFLAKAVATSDADLFELNGRLVRLDAGALVTVNKDALREGGVPFPVGCSPNNSPFAHVVLANVVVGDEPTVRSASLSARSRR